MDFEIFSTNFFPWYKKIKGFVLAHKIISIIAIIILVWLIYYTYGKLTSIDAEPRYVLATVEKGTIISSISGTGQVSATNQIDLKAKVSGDVVYLGVANGQTIKGGALLVQLNSIDAQKSVRDAETNLQSAKLSLQKLTQPADKLSTIQAENALTEATTGLEKAYDDGFNSVSNTFVSLPPIMVGFYDILYGSAVTKGQDNVSAYSDMVKAYNENVAQFRDTTVSNYNLAKTSYDKNFLDYRATTRFSDKVALEKLINETYDTTKTVAEAIKSASDLLSFVKDRLTERNLVIPPILTTHQNSLATYTSQTNSQLLTLLDIRNNISSSKFAIAEKTESLSKLKTGPDQLDVKSSELSLTQRQNALDDAKENLANYYIRAPFDSTVAKLNVKKADSVSNGTVVATVITATQLANVSLNEVDAAKVRVGDKVTLTFDAVEGLEISGKVASLDTIGTVSQGVVTYTVEISFDTQDSRVKPGMSVSAAIITDVRQDTLIIPGSAIKTDNSGATYVEAFSSPLVQSATSSNQGLASKLTPLRIPVQIGISDDSSTEILSGLKEGDQVISRTMATTATPSASQAPSILNAAGVRTTGR